MWNLCSFRDKLNFVMRTTLNHIVLIEFYAVLDESNREVVQSTIDTTERLAHTYTL